MSSKHTLKFSVAFSLTLSFLCAPPMQPASASHNSHRAQRAEDRSPAYKEGMEALGAANYEKAAEHFKQAAADKPDDMWAFYYFGLCLLKLRRFDEAATVYKQVMAIKPEAAVAHYQLGKTYLEMGDREAAEKERRWLQEHDQELALYLSDLFPSDKPAPQQTQETSTPSTTPQTAGNKAPSTEPMTSSLRPTILYREKAKYTEIARINRVQGTVALRVVFAVNGAIQDLRVVRGLPDGLTHKAIEAARAIRFNPATKDGEPVSVRGALEFTFNLY